MPEIMVREINCHQHANDLIEKTGLIIHDVVRPITIIDHVGRLDHKIIAGQAGQILHIFIEESRFDFVDGLGMGQVIDQVDKARGDGNLPHHFGVVHGGNRLNLR